MIDLDRSFRTAPCVTARRIGDEYLVFDLSSGRYFGLNEVGQQVWTQLSRGHTVRQACALLQEEYEVDASDLQADVERLVLQFLEFGWLV